MSEIVGVWVEGFCGEVLYVDEGLVDFEEEGGDFVCIGEVLWGEWGGDGGYCEGCFGGYFDDDG